MSGQLVAFFAICGTGPDGVGRTRRTWAVDRTVETTDDDPARSMGVEDSDNDNGRVFVNHHIRARALVAPVAVAIAVATQSTAALAQDRLQSDLARDIENLERKYVTLAEAMPASTYDWRPMEGVRSVNDVYCHVAGATYFIAGSFGAEKPGEVDAMQEACANGDVEARKAAAVEYLRVSFGHAKQFVEAVGDVDLDQPTKLFGRDTTYRAAMLLFVTHMHEHLGQSVAYARSNGVVPPWSAGG